ncbi:N5,N10-methylene tetrahydromethanopterin reductase [Labrys miyagiensis]|uniref:N5,N10-methylene tetrahydromethanopterin reductase n=1 Tax=Labrys miyagiensis TaxID=346912 RepID=A0ABQ6CV48_9HYPH|nr:LLM class flavin-dependent oxidoreductase [Labrys miyagiensis]GLS22855.1 N5,N10-methylene tetrahydromethanopterin reductase [Labrys miyagiensis]
MIPLSVLDLSPVTTATSGAVALRNTLDLAQLADQLGFTRYWLAEHHNARSIASSAPDIMIGQVAAVTQHVRVGSGGVMLPNHAPLMVAERFKVLEALFPGRVDLGIGRAAGTDPVTSNALRRQDVTEDDFLQRFQELVMFETREFPEAHPFHAVHAVPIGVPLPPIWLLGSSGYSADLAATAGAGFSFAHHFAKYDAATAMHAYRRKFCPSQWRDRPYAILAVHVVCAETDAEAERLAATYDLTYARSSRGEYLPLASPEEALAYAYALIDRERIQTNRARMFVGSPATIHSQLLPLVEATQADELMVSSMIYDHGARRRSYELMAERFGLTGAARTNSNPPLYQRPYFEN